ncbi:MAG: histidine phosphatase family protein [Acidimicrobiales bacterium]|jgi:broad specificity phosphatase PhoE
MLFLVRHGQSEANAAGLVIGRTDSPLTELGHRQAVALGDALASRGAAACRILTSPLQRAEQTAEAVAAGYARAFGPEALSPPEIDGRFVEFDYGELDETPLSGFPPGFWERWRSDPAWRPPGGETLGEVGARVTAACEELSAEAARGDVVVVTHLSPVRAAVVWALGGGPELSWRLSLGVASITRISTAGPFGTQLASFNETGHLAGLA